MRRGGERGGETDILSEFCWVLLGSFFNIGLSCVLLCPCEKQRRQLPRLAFVFWSRKNLNLTPVKNLGIITHKNTCSYMYHDIFYVLRVPGTT